MPYKDKNVHREYVRKWVATRRANFFVDKFCAHCGSNEQLELDHIDPNTKITNHIWSWSEKRRQEEIEKCQILCHNCHVVKTITNHERSHSESHPHAILSENQVTEIRSKWNDGDHSKRGMAKDYGVTEHTIRFIIARKTWKHL
jgi:hypothetical protein